VADNTPSDVPAVPIPPIVDLAGTGGDPDEKTVVRPRKKAEPKAETPATSEIGNRTASEISAPAAAAVPPAVAVPPVEAAPATPAPVAPAAPVAQEPAAPQNPYAQPNPYAAAPAAPAAQPNPYAAAPTAPQPYSYGPYVPQPPKGLSIASMSLGIGGLLFSFAGLGFLIVVGAIITGHLAAKRQPYAKGFWITGLVTGYLGLGFSLIYGVIWLLFIIAAFSSGSY
jgi:hypothetical protein